MTADFLNALKTLFSLTWGLLTSFYLPGTNITPGAMLLFGAFTVISLKFVFNVLGLGSISGANIGNAVRRQQGKSKKDK